MFTVRKCYWITAPIWFAFISNYFSIYVYKVTSFRVWNILKKILCEFFSLNALLVLNAFIFSRGYHLMFNFFGEFSYLSDHVGCSNKIIDYMWTQTRTLFVYFALFSYYCTDMTVLFSNNCFVRCKRPGTLD